MTEPAPTPAPSPAPAPAPTPPARPAEIPEKFWDGAKGEARVIDLAKSYTELETGRGKMKETLSAEINAERLKGRPAKADDYKFALPETVKDIVIFDKQPGDDFKAEPGKTYAVFTPDDPLAKGVRALAWEYGVPPEKVNGLMAELARKMGHRAPTADESAAARAEALKPLGEHGEQRLQHVDRTLAALIGEDKARALRDAPGTPTAVEAVEALLEKAGQAKFSAGTAAVDGAATEIELKAIQASPAYLAEQSADAPLHRKVAAGWAKLYPPGSGLADRVLNPSGAR